MTSRSVALCETRRTFPSRCRARTSATTSEARPATWTPASPPVEHVEKPVGVIEAVLKTAVRVGRRVRWEPGDEQREVAVSWGAPQQVVAQKPRLVDVLPLEIHPGVARQRGESDRAPVRGAIARVERVGALALAAAHESRNEDGHGPPPTDQKRSRRPHRDGPSAR